MTYLGIKLAIAFVVMCGVGVKALGEINHRAKARRRLRSAPTTLADHALVTLTGTVRALGAPLVAPLSGTACVLHRSVARVYAPGRRNGPRSIAHEHAKFEMIEFVLETRDAKVIVDGEHADVTIRPGPIIPRKLERETAFLAAAQIDAHPSNAGFDEIVIEVGMRISVHGVARVEINADASREAGFRDAPTLVRLVGDARHPLTISPA